MSAKGCGLRPQPRWIRSQMNLPMNDSRLPSFLHVLRIWSRVLLGLSNSQEQLTKEGFYATYGKADSGWTNQHVSFQNFNLRDSK